MDEGWNRRAAAAGSKGRVRVVALFGAAALVLAACGGGGSSKKSTAAANETSTTTSTTTVADVSTTAAPDVSTTSTTAAGGTAVTSAATKTVATAKKTTSITQPSKTVAPVSGIVSVGGTTTTVSSGPPPQPGGTLTQIIQSENQGFDPTKMGINGASTDGTSGAALYDPLLYNDPFDGQTHPNIADSMTSSDGLVWTMKIHPNVKFSDGTPFDANAVKYNYQRHQDPSTGSIRAGFANQIKTMDVLDSQTLRLTLTATNFLFPRIVATNLGWIASPTALQLPGDYNSHPSGAGPFVLKQWVRGSTLSFTRNPTYWRAPLPYLDQLVLKIITDPNQQSNSYKANEADVISGTSQQVADSFKSTAKIVSLELLAGTNVEFNVVKGPFADANLRRAIVMAFDRDAYAKQFGWSRAQNSVMPPASPYYDASVLQLAYDSKAADTIFQQYASTNGGPLSFNLGYVQNTTTQAIAEYIQAIMAQHNVKVTLQPGTLQVAISKLTSGDFQAYEFGGTYNDPDPWVQNFLCDSRPAPNVVGFCDPKFDQLAAQGRSSQDLTARVNAYREAQKMIYSQAPMMYYEPALNFYVFRSNVQAIRQFENGAIFYGDLWIQQHG